MFLNKITSGAQGDGGAHRPASRQGWRPAWRVEAWAAADDVSGGRWLESVGGVAVRSPWARRRRGKE
jgi:hypothetical protein